MPRGKNTFSKSYVNDFNGRACEDESGHDVRKYTTRRPLSLHILGSIWMDHQDGSNDNEYARRNTINKAKLQKTAWLSQMWPFMKLRNALVSKAHLGHDKRIELCAFYLYDRRRLKNLLRLWIKRRRKWSADDFSFDEQSNLICPETYLGDARNNILLINS